MRHKLVRWSTVFVILCANKSGFERLYGRISGAFYARILAKSLILLNGTFRFYARTDSVRKEHIFAHWRFDVE
jgi:hypothetical protein